MARLRRIGLTSVLVLGLALTAASCSSDDPVGEPDDGADSSDPADGTDADDGESADEPTTLAEFFGVPWLSFNPEDQRTVMVRQQQRVQELVAECMAQEGFEYVPAAAPQSDFFYSDPFDADFAREHGFGITTSFDMAGKALHGSIAGADWSDPNSEIVDALSESERAAYHETLYGEASSVGTRLDPDTGEVEEFSDLGDLGCMGQAQSEVWEDDKLDVIFEQLDLDSMYERVEADPRMLAFIEDWSDCMNGRGYAYDHPESMYDVVDEHFSDRLEELVGGEWSIDGVFFGLLEEAGLTEEEAAVGKSPEEFADLYKQAEQRAMENVDREALSALQDEERSLAVANSECSVGMLEVFQEVAEEYEAQFIQENRATLEQYRSDSGD